MIGLRPRSGPAGPGQHPETFPGPCRQCRGRGVLGTPLQENAQMKQVLTAAALVSFLLVAASGSAADKPSADTAAAVPSASTAPVPAGAYTLDKAHASLLFRVNHLSFSHWTARFTKFDAQLQYDPVNPAKSSLKVTVDPKSIYSDNAPEGFMATLAGPEWLDAGKYPEMTYRSTKVERVGTNGL